MKVIYTLLLFNISFSVFANVVIDLADIKEGTHKFVNWMNVPVLIFHRNENQINTLNLSPQKKVNVSSVDFYARRYGNSVANAIMKGNHVNEKQLRSLKDRWFVSIGASPELGIKLIVKSKESVIMDSFDGTLYDLSGRVIDVSSIKKDLSIPNYSISNQILTIFTKSLTNVIDFSKGKVNLKEPPHKQVVDALFWNKFKLAESILDKHPETISVPEVNLAIMVVTTTYGKKELLEKAINYGADINILFKNKSTPLNTAILSNHMEIAKYLIKSGAKVDEVCDPTNKRRCSTPTLQLAKMIEGVESELSEWIKNKR